MNTTDAIADRAINDLAWLVGNHVAVRTREQPVLLSAEMLLRDPDRNLHIANYEEAEAEIVKVRLANMLRWLGTRLIDIPSDPVGAYLNKAAIVYADAILQGVLPQMFEAQFGRTLQGRSLGRYLENSSNTGGLCDLDALPNAKTARLLAELRHLITHKGGIVDRVFVEQCRTQRLWCDVWPDEASFFNAHRDGQGADLSIETVIIPCIARSAMFVYELRGAYSRIP